MRNHLLQGSKNYLEGASSFWWDPKVSVGWQKWIETRTTLCSEIVGILSMWDWNHPALLYIKIALVTIRCIKLTYLFCYQRYSNWMSWYSDNLLHDDVIKWKHFPRYRPFVRGIHRSPVNSPHKGQWRRALMFSLICVWINGRVNNRGDGD